MTAQDTGQDTAQKSRKPRDYTAPYRCPFGHQSDLYLKMNFQHWVVREGFMIEPKPKIMDVELPKTDQPYG